MENRVNGEPEVVGGDLYFVQDQHLVLVYPKHQIKVIFIISYSNAYIKCCFSYRFILKCIYKIFIFYFLKLLFLNI